MMAEIFAFHSPWPNPGAVRDMAGFFIQYAEHLPATGDRPMATRYAKKALRMNLEGNAGLAKRAAAVIGDG